jgi:hypothetical protein
VDVCVDVFVASLDEFLYLAPKWECTLSCTQRESNLPKGIDLDIYFARYVHQYVLDVGGDGAGADGRRGNVGVGGQD